MHCPLFYILDNRKAVSFCKYILSWVVTYFEINPFNPNGTKNREKYFTTEIYHTSFKFHGKIIEFVLF